MRFIIVSGLSGSGKTIGLHALEDLGYYCIDNLPGRLLPQLARHILDGGDKSLDRVAVGIDARNRSFLSELPAGLSELTEMGFDYQIMFLDADESILIKRYKETRRRHPLTDSDTSLLEGIEREKVQLEPLSSKATIRIDTTYTTPHELRRQIRDFAESESIGDLTLLFRSFGFKHGTPLDADYVFDIRCLPNPYWQPELRRYTGLDEPVIEFMQKHGAVSDMIDSIREFLEKWIPAFRREHRNYITIAIGCTGGLHRSVYVADRLARHFAGHEVHTQVRHRELT
jgi:UPF0042 nucleotide-binding protein